MERSSPQCAQSRASVHPALAFLVERARVARDQARWADCTALVAVAMRETLYWGEDRPLPELLNLLGAVDFQRGEMDGAERRFAGALRAVTNDPSRRAAALVNLGAVANVRGRFDDALRFYRRGRRSYREANNPIGQARALHNMGMVLADRKRWRRSAWCYEAAHELATSGEEPLLLGFLALNKVEVYLAMGELSRARVACDEACLRLTALGALPGVADVHRRYGEIFRRQGDTQTARRHLRLAVRTARRVGSPLPEAEALRELGSLAAEEGDHEHALLSYGRALRLFRSLDAGHELADSVIIDIVEVMGRQVERSDLYLFGHSSRVAQYSAAIAAELGMDSESIKAVLVAGYLHDVGKLQIDPAILGKNGPLSAEERAMVSLHSALGAERLGRFDLPWGIGAIVRAHHEEYDGSGYPDALRGDSIPLAARILHVADVFDSLTSHRPWRAAWGRQASIEYLAGSAGRLFDMDVVSALLRVLAGSGLAQGDSSDASGTESPPAVSFRQALAAIPLRARRVA